MTRLLREVSRYTAASFLALLLDIALLALQVDILGVPYLLAAAIAFLAGTVFIYWAAIRHIFAYRRIDDQRAEFALFLAIGVIGLIVNLSVIYVAVDGLSLHYIAAKLAAASCTFAVNFGLRRWWLFTRWKQRDSVTPAEEVAS